MSQAVSLPCPGCGIGLAPAIFSPGSFISCPSCQRPLGGAVFPAFQYERESPVAVAVPAAEAEATCFFHPGNRAQLSCERCGRFVCEVCDLKIGVRHLCPTCVSAGLTTGSMPEVVAGRFLWSDAAFWAGIGPLVLGIVIWPFIVATGALAIFLALFGWKRPVSLVRGRRRWAAIVGLIGGALQIAAWFGMIFLVFGRHF